MQLNRYFFLFALVFSSMLAHTQGNPDKMRANLEARKVRALQALEKAEIEYRIADSLRLMGRRGDRDADLAEDEILRRQAALEKRVFGEQLPEIEKRE
ncbi:MAG: hypothetical protein ACRCZB_04430, partial [Bacteroidales bacterium]